VIDRHRRPTQEPDEDPSDPSETPGALTRTTVQLVPMRRRHLRAVLRIEAQVYPRPWSLTLYLSELNLRTSRHYVVARLDGNVVGYAGLLFAADEAHITTIAVDPAWHRHQIGTRLLLHQAWVARQRRAKHLTLEVRITNTPAQEMYGRFGFVSEGIRKNYYAEIHEDAVVMWARDIDTEAYRQRLETLAAGLATPTLDQALES
jgi:ribosomal-protein-alanine N-acetyltransferase